MLRIINETYSVRKKTDKGEERGIGDTICKLNDSKSLRIKRFLSGRKVSYTKFSKEVTKWLKENNLPCYGTAHDSPEETKARLDAWMLGMKHMLRKWIAEKRYRELISCAHGGWYTDDVIFEPLAEHFVENHLFDELRFLCERSIRFSIEDMLFCIKTEKEEHSALNVKTVPKDKCK